MEQLIALLSKKVALNTQDIELINCYFEPIAIAKNVVLEEQNKVPEYLYFIVSGFMRLFYLDENGDENTTLLSLTNDFIASFLDFIQGNPAKENVACITDCELLRIKKTDLKLLIESSNAFKEASLLIFQNALGFSDQRAKDLATLTAEQRYKKLLEEQPKILHSVPVQYIASYLGIKPESLSRIRKNINS